MLTASVRKSVRGRVPEIRPESARLKHKLLILPEKFSIAVRRILVMLRIANFGASPPPLSALRIDSRRGLSQSKRRGT